MLVIVASVATELGVKVDFGANADHDISQSDKSGMEGEDSDGDCVLDRSWETDNGA